MPEAAAMAALSLVAKESAPPLQLPPWESIVDALPCLAVGRLRSPNFQRVIEFHCLIPQPLNLSRGPKLGLGQIGENIVEVTAFRSLHDCSAVAEGDRD